jgi:1-acyl-sn-glycerol-3-phosphate acyltransferase
VRRRELLPLSGPAIVLANHNSHLDTLVLISLFPLRLLARIRPVAAADYFLRTATRAWFATRIVNIIPLVRDQAAKSFDPLEPVVKALNESDIVIVYPEGTRGEPERLAQFKRGIAHLAERFPKVPVIPIFLHGLGKALPKGDTLLVPFFCDVFVGDPLFFQKDKNTFMHVINERFTQLVNEGHFSEWD